MGPTATVERGRKRPTGWRPLALLATLAISALPQNATADEGGVSFWVPGFFGSLAAAPQVPGFSFTNILYYAQVSAGGNVAFAKQVPLGNINVNFNGSFNANVHARVEPLYLAAPGYTFATPVLGGQANVTRRRPLWTTHEQRRRDNNGQLGLGWPGIYDWA